MFVKLDKAEVNCISIVGVGRDGACGDVYLNTEYISLIDGCFVATEKYSICCTDEGLKKVLSAIEKEGVQG